MNTYSIILKAHYVSVTLFFIHYVIKTILLLANKQDTLQRYTRPTKIPEMIISFMFLLTGIYMLTQMGEIKSMMWIKILLVFASIPLAVIGFKKGNKIMAALSLLLITASYGLAEMSRKKVKADIPTALSNDGKAIFEGNCASCHGIDGKAMLSGASDLTTLNLDHAAYVNAITNGKGAMAAYDKMLNAEQIEAVATYAEGLKSK
jgi:mono/diheme cytochrome c family protein